MTMKPLRILLSSNTSDGAERINHLFRNAGHAAQTHRITSIEDLGDCLNDGQWDLAFCEQQNTEVDMHSVLEKVTESDTGTPVIFLSNELSNELLVDGLSRGAKDVIDIANLDHLLYAATREADSFQIKQRNKDLERSLEEVSNRFETLMAEADDAVAFVLDGMHVDVNEAYAEAFGQTDVDEFLGIPMVDLIAECDQEKYKAFIRNYNVDGEQELELDCVKTDGSAFPSTLRFAPAVFDGEKCTQVIVQREAPVQAEAPPVVTLPNSVDSVTGLQTRYGVVDQMDEFFLSDDTRGCVLYISINDFAKIKSRLGLSGSRKIRHAAAELISSVYSSYSDSTVGHYGEDSFIAFLPNLAASDAISSARKLCSSFDENMFEVDEQTIQSNCCIGLVDFSIAEFTDSNEAMDTAFLTLERAKLMFSADKPESGIACHEPESEVISELCFDIAELDAAERLKMLFQPVINLHGTAMDCYESTLRMLDEDGEEQAVDGLFQFFNQKSGDTSLDKWLVLQGTKKLLLEVEQDRSTVLIINLSQNALLETEFTKWLSVAIKAAGLPPSSIVLQFAEDTVTHYLKQAMRFREDLSEHDFRFGLKHVGQAPDSFKVLENFHPDFAFLHPEFTTQLQNNVADSEDLRKALLKLAPLNTKSILPFVSNAATMACLWQLNVDYIQGEYLQARTEDMDYEFSDPDAED